MWTTNSPLSPSPTAPGARGRAGEKRKNNKIKNKLNNRKKITKLPRDLFTPRTGADFYQKLFPSHGQWMDSFIRCEECGLERIFLTSSLNKLLIYLLLDCNKHNGATYHLTILNYSHNLPLIAYNQANISIAFIYD